MGWSLDLSGGEGTFAREVLWQYGMEKGAVGSGPVVSFPCTTTFSHETLRNPQILSMNLVLQAVINAYLS